MLKGIEAQAKKNGLSFNQLAERLGFMYCQLTGEIPLDDEPLGEGRGGDRTTQK